MRQLTIKQIEAMRYHCEVREADDCPYWIDGSGVYKQPDISDEGQYICERCTTHRTETKARCL